MQAPVAANDLLELLEKSGLLTAGQVRKVRDKLQIDPDASAEATARRLVKERVLTPFQAERLTEGRYRGLVIDGYRIRELLGFGGMGCVFIAEDPADERKVAMKVLAADHALDAGMLARMKLESVAGMRLKHPNIVRTETLGTTGAVHYLVMELVRGITLHELVALHGALKAPMACDIALQAAEALRAAHKAGIVHRDIKPANILIDNTGTARLLDFGLALIGDVADEEFSLSMVFGHDCLGTPDYIAPEQIVDSRKVDGRADLYSLGATLYVALTARVPFPDKLNKAKLEAHRTRQPPDVCEVNPEVPREIGDIVMRLMSKDPAQRFASAAELIAALQPLARRKPVQFDFRELVTLRAKQAKARNTGTAKKISGPRSSITSASGWLQSSGHHFSAAVSPTDGFGRGETPPARTPATGARRRQEERNSGSAPIRPVSSHVAVPQGWRLQISGQRGLLPVTRARMSIGSAAEANVRISSAAVDGIQCWIEFDGSVWRFRQESRALPSFVDGSAEAYRELRHGSRITFGDRTGVRLISLERQERTRRLRRKLLVFALSLTAFSLAAWYAWQTFFRP
jgi:serine/threonine protein kinase